jgi:hypothetical protein
MTNHLGSSVSRASGLRDFLWALLLMLAVIAVIFYPSFQPGQALFANDGNLGVVVGHADNLVGQLTGTWQELNLAGIELPSATPNANFALLVLLGPFLSAKFTAALSLVAVAMSCWFFFRVLGFPSWICVLGGLATALNSNIFSNTCWGVFMWTFSRSFIFLALAAISSSLRNRFLPKLILAGLATGMAIMEGYDIGAIFSLYVAAYTAFMCWRRPGPLGVRLGRTAGSVALVALCAALIAAHGLVTLIGTQIKGIASMDGKQQSTEQRWKFATQWSLPKIETLRLIIPGLFGYRMDTENGGQYWGAVGQEPGWFEHHQGYPRHSGEGEYAGVLVVLVAAWAVFHLWRKKGNPFTDEERRAMGFWAAAALVSLLMAYGRHAPLYRLYFSLPFFSTMRNPVKFLAPFNLSLLILFGYGLMGMGRVYLTRSGARAQSFIGQIRSWWSSVAGFDKRWVYGCLGFLGVSILGWMIFTSSRTEMMRYLGAAFYGQDEAALPLIFRFASREIGLYVLCLSLAIGVILLLMSGALAGKRLKWAAVLVGLFICGDMIRANTPWIKFYDYRDKYASNPVIDFLKQRPYEYRVEIPHVPMSHTPIYFPVPKEVSYFPMVCFAWLEHLFQYYRIQSLAINQVPRLPGDYSNFFNAFGSTNPIPTRLWQLTNTRYFLTLASYLEAINAQLDPQLRRFKILTPFALTNTPGGNVGAVTNTTGPFAVVEFTGALPRALMLSRWQNYTNDSEVLRRLADPGFDPTQLLLVSGVEPVMPATSPATTNAGTVAITRYRSKHVQCAVDAELPSILLLNDKYQPSWKAWVDGQPATLLRCNYIMRGIYLTPGKHQVDFQFEAPTGGLYVTLAAMAVGLGLIGLMAWGRGTKPVDAAAKPVAARNEGSGKQGNLS